MNIKAVRMTGHIKGDIIGAYDLIGYFVVGIFDVL